MRTCWEQDQIERIVTGPEHLMIFEDLILDRQNGALLDLTKSSTGICATIPELSAQPVESI